MALPKSGLVWLTRDTKFCSQMASPKEKEEWTADMRLARLVCTTILAIILAKEFLFPGIFYLQLALVMVLARQSLNFY